MKYPYGLMADLHCHNWSAFAEYNKDGISSRLIDITNEMGRCCEAVFNAGGDTVVVAGDVFHTRGKINSIVFNWVKTVVKSMFDRYGIRWIIIDGNHDVIGDKSSLIGSTVESLSGPYIEHWHCSGFNDKLALVPWTKTKEDFKNNIDGLIACEDGVDHLSKIDLICHAGVDGAVSGIPDRGDMGQKYFESLPFKRVFSGDYHNMKKFGDRVFSVGTPTYQTWSSVGTTAGWWLVYEDKEEFYASHAPQFIELNGKPNEFDLLEVDGNFVKAKLPNSSLSEMEKYRKLFNDNGAKGVVFQFYEEEKTERGEIKVESLSIKGAVSRYIAEKKYPKTVMFICANALDEVESDD